MKISILIFPVLMIPAMFAAAQQNSGRLTGYWMEKDSGSELSLSTLLVFDLDIAGNVEGTVYFMDAQESNRSFSMAKIRVDGNCFSFQIDHTSISFYGELNNSGQLSKGTFILDGDTSFEVSHQKLSGKNLKSILGVPGVKARIIRRHVDADDGLTTS